MPDLGALPLLRSTCFRGRHSSQHPHHRRLAGGTPRRVPDLGALPLLRSTCLRGRHSPEQPHHRRLAGRVPPREDNRVAHHFPRSTILLVQSNSSSPQHRLGSCSATAQLYRSSRCRLRPPDQSRPSCSRLTRYDAPVCSLQASRSLLPDSHPTVFERAAAVHLQAIASHPTHHLELVPAPQRSNPMNP